MHRFDSSVECHQLHTCAIALQVFQNQFAPSSISFSYSDPKSSSRRISTFSWYIILPVSISCFDEKKSSLPFLFRRDRLPNWWCCPTVSWKQWCMEIKMLPNRRHIPNCFRKHPESNYNLVNLLLRPQLILEFLVIFKVGPAENDSSHSFSAASLTGDGNQLLSTTFWFVWGCDYAY